MDIWSLSVVLEFQLCGRVDMKWRHSQRENSRTKGGGKRKGSTSSKTANWPLHVTFPRPVGPMDGLLWNGAVGYNLNIYLIISQQLQVKSSAFVGKERVMNEGSCVILVSYRAWTNWSPCATEKKGTPPGRWPCGNRGGRAADHAGHKIQRNSQGGQQVFLQL